MILKLLLFNFSTFKVEADTVADTVVEVGMLLPPRQPRLALEAGKYISQDNSSAKTINLHLHRLKHHFLFSGEEKNEQTIHNHVNMLHR